MITTIIKYFRNIIWQNHIAELILTLDSTFIFNKYLKNITNPYLLFKMFKKVKRFDFKIIIINKITDNNILIKIFNMKSLNSKLKEKVLCKISDEYFLYKVILDKHISISLKNLAVSIIANEKYLLRIALKSKDLDIIESVIQKIHNIEHLQYIYIHSNNIYIKTYIRECIKDSLEKM